MSMIKFPAKQMAKVLICMIMAANVWAATPQQVRSCISRYGDECTLWDKDFRHIANIRIDEVKLLEDDILFGESCKKWRFNERTLREFFSISRAYETSGASYHAFNQFPCVISGSFTLDNVEYRFEIQAGGSFDIIDKDEKTFCFGCDEMEDKRCEKFLPF